MIDPDYRGRLGITIRDPYQVYPITLYGTMEELRGRAIVLRLDESTTINGRRVERAVVYPSVVERWWYEEG